LTSSSYRLRAVAGLLVLAVLTLAVVLVVAQAFSAPAQASAGSSGLAADPGQVSSAAVEDGRQLFLSDCASCHGTMGQGSSVAPSLQNAGPATVDFYLRTGRMPLGQLGVPSWQQERSPLDPAQIQAIESYVATIGSGPAIPNVVASAGDLHRGWELFINNCAACHSATGAGGSIGGNLSAPPLSRADAQTVAEAILIGPGAMPQFSFSQDDVNAIAAYVEYLHNTPTPGGLSMGGEGTVPEGLIAGVLGLGLLIVVTRWVVGRKGQIAPAEQLAAPAAPAEPADANEPDERAPARRQRPPWPGDSA
jgi:ubiquinol-cytochrome c reductase cytochrome c subunit